MYLEDFHVGQRFESGTLTIDASQIKAFAAQFDPQPFHLDEQRACESFFGQLVASGWHTASLSMRLLVQSVPIERGCIGAGGEISWPNATRAGDTFRVTSEVVRVSPSRTRPERGIVELRSETRALDGRILQIYSGRLVVFRRPQPAAATL